MISFGLIAPRAIPFWHLTAEKLSANRLPGGDMARFLTAL